MSAPACSWCKGPINREPESGTATVPLFDGEAFTEAAREDARFCSRKCRQTAFRIRRRNGAVEADGEVSRKRLAYADPPYPGLAKRYYGREDSYAGEVDFPALVQRLETFDGWALSTSERSLRWLLPLCPEEARLCPWVKPKGVPPATYGLHNSWEALIVKPARELRPGKPDFLRAQPARFGGTLMGRKPLAFCAFLFGALGALPGDSFEDMFPGTGIVTRAWEELSLGAGVSPARTPSG